MVCSSSHQESQRVGIGSVCSDFPVLQTFSNSDLKTCLCCFSCKGVAFTSQAKIHCFLQTPKTQQTSQDIVYFSFFPHVPSAQNTELGAKLWRFMTSACTDNCSVLVVQHSILSTCQCIYAHACMCSYRVAHTFSTNSSCLDEANHFRCSGQRAKRPCGSKVGMRYYRLGACARV